MDWKSFLEQLLKDFRYSTYKLEKKHNIKSATISKILTGKTKKPSQETIEDLEKVFNIKIDDNDPENLTYRLISEVKESIPGYGVPEHYTWPLSFWKRGIGFLFKAKKISKAYSLKQIRPTLASYLINNLKMDIFTVKKLLDHSDVKITDNHYIDFRVDNVRKELDEISLNNFID